jgi:RNA polymerase sigma-70 factor (ECF subfamily)
MRRTKNFEEFYDKWFKYVFYLVRQYIPDEHTAEDIISEIFINLWQLYDDIDDEKNTKSLVHTISKRRINDALRKKYKFEANITYVEDIDSFESKTESPEFKNDKAILRKLESTIKSFGDSYFQIYKLKYQRNLTNREISEEMGITINYVKVLHNRLIKKLKDKW